MRALRLAAALCAVFTATLAPAAAQTTVKWFISETNPNQTAWQREVAQRYEAQTPGTKIDIQVMAGEPYKAKLTTMLQSADRPHLIYTWGGGVLFAQADAGLLQDITVPMKGAWGDSFSPAALDAMTYKGRVYGAPIQFTRVVLWYNKALMAKGGVDPAGIKTWDDLLAATSKLKAAGIQPFTVGGADKWPLNMFWASLALRIGGKQAFTDAMNRTGAGFDGPAYLQASERFKQLIDLDPFQKGFLGDTFPQAGGQFGDGKSAMQLMGNWLYSVQRSQSANQKGLSDAELGWLPFPAVPGGKGDPSDVLGGINGFLVTKGAPPEAVAFLRYYTSAEVQRDAAGRGFFIPVAKGAGEALQNPFFRDMAAGLETANYVQNFYDQMLGLSTGRVVNDTSADLAAGRMTPRQVGQAIQDAWDLER